MRRISALIVYGMIFAWTAPSQAVWQNVNLNFAIKTDANLVQGPGHYYEIDPPKTGPWTAAFDLRNHQANAEGFVIRVWSAETVNFSDHNVASGHAGKSSHIAFKFVSTTTPFSAVTWDFGTVGMHLSAGAKLTAKYSVDGYKWMNVYDCPPAEGDVALKPVSFTLPEPTNMIYLGWFAEVPEGKNCFWLLGDTGRLTFTPSPFANQGHFHGSRFVPNTFFATTTHVNSEGGIRLMRDLNMRTVRIDFPCVGFMPEKGQYNFSSDIWFIQSADLGLRSGLDQEVVVTTAPKWMQMPDGRFPSDENLGAFEEGIYQLAKKYKGKIKYWEAWNEPDMAVHKDRYVIMLKAFYRGIKRADPTNKVFMAAFAGDERWQLEQAYKYGAKGHFDILNSHSYTRPLPPEEGGYIEKIKDLHRVMVKYGDNKPCWVTEMGWNGVEASMMPYLKSKYPGHRSYACTEEDQARNLARLYLLSATVPWIERVYFFHLHQEAAYTETTENVDAYMGLFTPWLPDMVRPKEAYFAIKTVFAMLNEATYLDKIDLGSRVWALVFRQGGEATVALWSLDDGVAMALSDVSKIKSVTSMVGTPILIENNKLPLSGRPIYVKAELANLDWLKNQVRQAKFQGARSFTLSLGLDLKKSKADQPVVDVEVANTTNHPQMMPKVFLKAGSSWKVSKDVVADAKPFNAVETRNFPVPLVGPNVTSGEVFFDVTGSLSNPDFPVRVAKTIRYAIVPRVPEGFKADGQLGEWSRLTPITVGQVPDQRELIGWKGSDDCSAKWYAAWDKENFYFVAEVRDDVHVQKATVPMATEIWRHDSIQVGIDLAGDARPSSNVPNYDGVNDVEIGFALAKEGPMAYVWTNPNGKVGPVALKDFNIIRDDATKTTRYEAAIPWSTFDCPTPTAGKWMSMNLLVNDDDGAERKSALQWMPGMIYSKDPSLFAKVVFGD